MKIWVISIMLAGLTACGADYYPASRTPPATLGAACPAIDDGRGQCNTAATGILLCNGTWSFAACPQGTSCVQTNDGVGCF